MYMMNRAVITARAIIMMGRATLMTKPVFEDLVVDEVPLEDETTLGVTLDAD